MIIRRKGKNVGEIKNGEFQKRVKRSKHLFKKTQSWGFDYSAIKDYADKIHTVKVFDEENKKLYIISMIRFMEEKQVAEFKGGGLQMFVPLTAFKLIDKSKKND